jgi:DNA replication and repair protein RecF
MNVKSLTLKNFRNHNYLSYEFQKGLNIITGPNGIGKTNIVEAIYYLSMVRSFRTLENDNLIKKGNEKAEITSTVKEGDLIKKIKITINKDGRQILLNNKPISKQSELVKSVNVILFEPKDVLLFRGSPKERRNFLDVSISKKSNAYLVYLTQYEKLLKQRNEILKQDKIDEVMLETTTELLIKSASPIVSYRQIYVKDINDILNKIARALTGKESNIEIKYTPFVPFDDKFESSANKAFKGAIEGDLKRKATSIGIHREDFSVSLNGRDIAMFGSQGENRLVALALKLSPYFLIEDKDKRPIVVLDDVMSELDKEHRLRLIKFLSKMEQVFITATNLQIKDAFHYQLKKIKEVF